MSPASGDLIDTTTGGVDKQKCFHSINVPSEWGQVSNDDDDDDDDNDVSIQLMSPASGD